jgi:hypothetical protein
MSRAAIYDTILADSRLQALGFDSDSVLVNYDGDQRPTDELFMVITWNPETTALQGDDIFNRPMKSMTIWVHMYHKFSSDFVRVDSVFDILDDVLQGMVHVAGSDGQTVTLVEAGNRSRDMRDDTYETICRSCQYSVLSRETTTV